MKRIYVSLIMRIVGIGIIIAGIVLTIIPLFDFDVFTFELGKSIIYAFGFSFVGIVLIVLSVIYNSLTSINNTKSTDEIAESVKKTLTKEKKATVCPYCGNNLKKDSSKCSNCGASIKNK